MQKLGLREQEKVQYIHGWIVDLPAQNSLLIRLLSVENAIQCHDQALKLNAM
jgi:hypothetical protein